MNIEKTVTFLPVINFINTKIHVATMLETVSFISDRIDENLFTQHTVLNVAKFVNSQSDIDLKKAIISCNIINIDGMGLVWGARLLGYEVPERVAGIDLFVELIKLSEEKEYPVYFLGAKEEVLTTMCEKINATYPHLRIAGSHHGYFWDDEAAMVEHIRTSGAYLLFVAISSPKKEIFINRWKDKLGVRFVMGVGGSFDVLAGKTKRAPVFMQKFGLEWFYRFLQEPRRMWRRYLVTNTKFVWLILKEIWHSRKTRR